MEKLDNVIAALEFCGEAIKSVDACLAMCPYYGERDGDKVCMDLLLEDALAVIKALRTERDDLRKDIETLHRINEDWRDEVARLHERIVAARDLGAKTAPVAEACKKPNTNYTRIAKMGPWAMAAWIIRTGTVCDCCIRHGCCGIPEEEVTEEYCMENILMWLAQEVEDVSENL